MSKWIVFLLVLISYCATCAAIYTMHESVATKWVTFAVLNLGGAWIFGFICVVLLGDER